MGRVPDPRLAPAFYLATDGDGLFDAFVKGTGFRANARLSEALKFIRDNTGRSQGSVLCWNRELGDWESEFDLDPSA
jgi:hypothetical protein